MGDFNTILSNRMGSGMVGKFKENDQNGLYEMNGLQVANGFLLSQQKSFIAYVIEKVEIKDCSKQIVVSTIGWSLWSWQFLVIREPGILNHRKHENCGSTKEKGNINGLEPVKAAKQRSKIANSRRKIKNVGKKVSTDRKFNENIPRQLKWFTIDRWKRGTKMKNGCSSNSGNTIKVLY